MPESGKIPSSKWGMAMALTVVLLLGGAGAVWWAWTLMARSSQTHVVNLAPEEPVLKRTAPEVQLDGTALEKPAMVAPPVIEPAPQTPMRATVTIPVAARSESNTTVSDVPARPVELSEPGVIHEFSRLRTELERKKLEVEIARQEEELRALQTPAIPPQASPSPVASRLAAPLRVHSVFGRGGDLRAVIEQPGKGLATVAVGDRIAGETVAGISADAVVVHNGRMKRTLAFK